MKDIRVQTIAWDSPAGDDARRIRMTVFVDEQRVPPEIELDEIDPVAHHVLTSDAESGNALGTARLYEYEPGVGRIGRMAVLSEARDRGVGGAMMQALIEECRDRGWRKVVLDSQIRAIPFYARYGFTVCGPEHMDAGIPHKLMSLDLE